MPSQEEQDERAGSGVEDILASVRQDASDAIIKAAETQAIVLNAKMGEVMWAVALLHAKIIAQAQMGEEQRGVAGHMAEMVQIALPIVIAAVERNRRRREGLQPFDA